tara:strand:+ start:516 stop:1118 length:603 start_codon:yes stop_codon:yes gene_type:complete
MRLNKIGIIIVTFYFVISTSLKAYSTNPKEFIQELVNDAISQLSDKSVQQEEKVKFIENLAINHVDVKGLSLYTLGEIRKTTDKQRLERYQIAFEKYFLKSLTSRLTDYSSSDFIVTDSDQKSSKYTIVSSKVKPTNGDPEIKIDWRVYTKNPDKPLIRDLIVEGLSLARTQKEEFSSILNSNNNNVDILISKLEEFVQN